MMVLRKQSQATKFLNRVNGNINSCKRNLRELIIIDNAIIMNPEVDVTRGVVKETSNPKCQVDAPRTP